MDADQFAEFLRRHPLLAEQLRDLAVTAPAKRKRSLALLDDAGRNLFLLPLLGYLIGELGLPWRHPGGRYSPEMRDAFANWVTGDYARRSGERIMRFLELMESPRLREEWESLSDRLAKS